MNGYDHIARLYDLEHCDFSDDIELFLNMARLVDKPGHPATGDRVSILEVGCGTGRVTLALAEAGCDVVGIDRSGAMLDLARVRAADAGFTAQASPGRVRLEQLDVRDLDWTERFDLALYPLNGFLHLTTASDQLSALCNIHRALLPGGFLLIDLPNPHTVFTPVVDGQLGVRRRFPSEDGRPITSLISTQTDLAEQIQRLQLFYDEVGGDGLVCRTSVEMELRFVYRYEMVHLLWRAGFEVDAAYGSYGLDSYEGDSPIMLFVAHKPKAPQR